MIRRSLSVLAAMLLGASGALADTQDTQGTIVIVGSGEAAAAPEYARLTVSVTSLCYDTARAAKDANAVLANQLVHVLQGFALTPRDRVTASGGATVRQTEYVTVGTETRVLCELKWRATNTLAIELSALDSIPDLQDQLLAAIDAAQGIDPTRVAQTFAEVGQPGYALYPETLTKLRAQAQGKAYDDAKMQFDTFASRCAFQDARMTSITPPQYEVYPRRDGIAMDASVPTSTPLMPDDINVTARWRFEWTFTPSASCPMPQ